MKAVFVVLLGLLGTGHGQSLDCKGCKKVSLTAAKYLLSEVGLQGQINYIMEPVCGNAPDPDSCRKDLPEFWRLIAGYLFNGAEGWFAPVHLCTKYCPASIQSKEIPCGECSALLNKSTDFMRDKPTIDESVKGLVQVCQGFPRSEQAQCRQGVRDVVPIAMNLFGTPDEAARMWIDQVCSQAGCQP